MHSKMIKFLATNQDTGRTILGMIITAENVDYMKKGDPIHFDVEEMPGIKQIVCEEIMILYYETMEDAIYALKKLGYIDEDAQIDVLKSLNRQTH